MTFIAPRGQSASAKLEFTLPESITAPVAEGQVLGQVTVRLGDKIMAQCDITALHDVPELTFGKSLEILTEKFFRV
jgi:D-alanyl-D-alanine carboxypeptidase (penicillin-binding protein 5/6)